MAKIFESIVLLHTDPTSTTLDTAYLSDHLALDVASERAAVLDKLDGDADIDIVIVDATTVDTADCKRVLREFADRDTAVLLLTGPDPGSDVLQLGADAHLSASVGPETVVRTVERLRERAADEDADAAHAHDESEEGAASSFATRPLYRRYPREFYALWFLVAMTYGFGDIVSTLLAVLTTPGIVESNPIVAAVLADFGIPGFLAVKLAILATLLWISVDGAQSDDRFSYYWPPVVATVVGGALTGWNLWLLYGPR